MKTIIITLIYLTGLYASTPTSNHWAFSQVQNASGLPVKVVRTIKRRDFSVRLNNLNSWQQKFFRVKAWVARRKYTGIKLVYAPPLLNDKTLYFAGMGDVCRPLDGTAMVYGAEKNQDGASRLYNVQVVAAHEVGHNCGAKHDDSLPVTIMHSFAAHEGYIHERMGFSENSKQQIRRCVK
jgi:hypothetical protein